MKYRQWKKNYQKRYGHNPPLKLDKRKQRRVARKALREIAHITPDIATIAARAAEQLRAALANIAEAAGQAAEAMAQTFRSVAQSLRSCDK